MTKLTINGAAGRMGARIIALACSQPDLKVVAAIDAPECDRLGRDAGEAAGENAIGVALSDRCDVPFDVMIDFSSPQGTLNAIDLCLRAEKPIVIGTTGHSADASRHFDAAASRIAVVCSPNMSVGVNVMLRMVRQLAAALGDDYDIEIVECHHRFKTDAPSGTALALLDAAQGPVSSSTAAAMVIHGRHGAIGPRPRRQIGMHAVRLGDTVGEHLVHFGSLGETLTLSHAAHTRDTFAAGALRAARWVVSRPPGRYSMQDVLYGAAESR